MSELLNCSAIERALVVETKFLQYSTEAETATKKRGGGRAHVLNVKLWGCASMPPPRKFFTKFDT